MNDPLPPSVVWGALSVAVVLGLLGPTDGASPVRVAVLGLGALAVLPLLAWLRVVSFAPIAAAGTAAAAAAWLLGRGLAVPVAFVAASITGALVAAAITVVWPRRPAAGPGFASLIAALIVWGVLLPRVAIRPSPQLMVFGIDLSGPRTLGLLAVGLLVVAGLGLVNVARSPAGREMAAVGVAPELALRSGADATVVRVRAGLLAGLFAGWAGVLLVLDAGALPPLVHLGPAAAVVWLAVALLGGLGSIGGTVTGALVVGGLAPLLGIPEAGLAGLALVGVVATGGQGLADLARPAENAEGRAA